MLDWRQRAGTTADMRVSICLASSTGRYSDAILVLDGITTNRSDVY